MGTHFVMGKARQQRTNQLCDGQVGLSDGDTPESALSEFAMPFRIYVIHPAVPASSDAKCFQLLVVYNSHTGEPCLQEPHASNDLLMTAHWSRRCMRNHAIRC